MTNKSRAASTLMSEWKALGTSGEGVFSLLSPTGGAVFNRKWQPGKIRDRELGSKL